MMRLRPTTADDETVLKELLYHSISVAPGDAAPPREIVELPELVRYIRGWGTSEEDRGTLAEVNGAIVGGAWLRLWRAEEHGYGFVNEHTPELSMAVLPDHRGEGIGTELLRRVLEEAARHHDAVSLSVSEHNRARRLYERAGFVPVGSSGDSITMLRDFRERTGPRGRLRRANPPSRWLRRR